MKQILSIAQKDCKLLFRDKQNFFWILMFPILMALFFGSLFSGGGSRGAISLAIIDQDQSKFSKSYIQKIKDIKVIRSTVLSFKEAEHKVRKGKLVAYLQIQKGFGKSPMLFMGSNTKLRLGIDPSKKTALGYLQGLLVQAAFQASIQAMSDPKVMGQQMDTASKSIDKAKDLSMGQKLVFKGLMSSLKTFSTKVDPKNMQAGSGGPGGQKLEVVSVFRDKKKQPRSSYDLTFPASIIWGIMSCVISFAVSLVKEEMQGTFLRLRIAPLTRAQILAGKGLACFFVSMLTIGILLFIGLAFFNLQVGSYLLLLLAMVCTSLSFVGLMMFISVTGRTTESVSGAGWAVSTVFAMIGGVMIPILFMPTWMRTISHFSPAKWAIISLEGALWRGFTFQEMLLPCGFLLAFGLFFFVLGNALFKRRGIA